ncbi:MAG: septal ring lytic transglycosylase RlpA family protein [Patescibacteria group bacterium]
MLFQSAEINTIAETSPSPPNIPADAWFSRDIAYAVNHYMLLQQQNGEVVPPDKKLNRGEMATILYRFLQNKANAQFGYASWYADGLAKTKLTVGLEYKEKNLTAAHRDFPFGTILKVTNMNNGKQIEVVVNDRGPFVPGRIIDLSKSAFSALESTSAGVISVRVEQFKAEK